MSYETRKRGCPREIGEGLRKKRQVNEELARERDGERQNERKEVEGEKCKK